ncbi:MAG: hypothetical protein KDK63_00965 [Chlamydiia bacterium]|nr:hypothetical protein [Chlamydiia bacterium]
MVKVTKEDSVKIDPLEEEMQKQETPQKTVKLKKMRVSAEISGDIAERIKSAVYWTPGMTMAGFIEESLAKAIEDLEEEKGEKFPQRERRLVGGRPMI